MIRMPMLQSYIYYLILLAFRAMTALYECFGTAGLKYSDSVGLLL